MPYTIGPLGEDALLLEFGERIDPGCNARVHSLARRIAAQRPPWLRDLVPGYASLAVFVAAGACADTDPLVAARDWLQRIAAADVTPDEAGGQLVEIGVRYGGEDGPDLAALAAHVGLGIDEVVARHTAVEYQVAMLGFAPGFPYLLGLDPALAMPRLTTPRARVAAGSVGIGGAQTGIYPGPGPGGWRIIGRTTRVLFDPQRTPPALLAPGDRLRFIAIEGPGA